MKGIKYIVLVLGLAFVTKSCDTFLEEELVTDVAASSYYTTEAGFEDAVRGTYSLLKNFYGPERGWSFTSFGTDNFTNGADGGHKTMNFYDGGLNATHGYFRDAWRDWYKGVNQANAVVNRSQNIEMDATKKAIRIAEARFLRALYYFDLTRTYGDVHLTLEETEGVELEANKTAASEIYSQAIIPDLEFAIANLPETQSDYGRATKPAAEFLLAKVHLTLSYGSGGAASASQAENLLTRVISTGGYGFELLPDWGDLWDITNQENSEIVWNLTVSKAQVDAGIDGNGHRAHLYFLMEYDKKRGMTRDIANGRPWKRFRPTPYLLGAFDRSMDERYDKGFKHVWYANKDVSDDRGNLMIGDTALFIPGPGTDLDWPQSEKDAAPYVVYTTDDYTERTFPSVNKWIDDTRPDRQKTQGQRDVVMMRLGDAYMLRAEARLIQNNTIGAAADINVIRNRAAVPGMEAAMLIAPGDVTLDFLLDERSRELYAEGHRWWTLARTGKLVERVRAHNIEAAGNIQDYHNVRPIPQQQIDGTIGGYPQNPGYPN